MKLVFMNLFLLVACVGFVDYVTANAHELTFDVTSMVGRENDYLALKRQRPSLRRPAEEKLRQKEDICMAILADEFFDVHKVEMVNPNHKTIYKQLKQQHPEVHDEHFKSSENIKPNFANPYKPGDVSVLGKITREYMFTCIARNCTTKTIHQYFVSPKYSVTEGGATKMVRYVFERNDKKEIVLMAKAVEKKVVESPDPAGQKTTTKAKPESKDSYDDTRYDDDKDTEEDTEEDEEDEDDESW